MRASARRAYPNQRGRLVLARLLDRPAAHAVPRPAALGRRLRVRLSPRDAAVE